MLAAFLLWFLFAVVQQDSVLKGNKYEIMNIVKKELVMENEIKIMDGKAAITRCKNSNIWQMRMWISREKKYYRVTTNHLINID